MKKLILKHKKNILNILFNKEEFAYFDLVQSNKKLVKLNIIESFFEETLPELDFAEIDIFAKASGRFDGTCVFVSWDNDHYYMGFSFENAPIESCPSFTKEELKHLVDTWNKLYQAETPYIILTEDEHGKFSIEGKSELSEDEQKIIKET